jgi:GMP synthase-like glutamine amidotransferase
MAPGRRAGLILQHGDSGPPAILGDWLAARGIEHEVLLAWREPLPASPADYGWIASLGSEHTPGAEGAPPWVDAEIELMGRALELDIPVLGLCFGGQALALAAGGAVARSEPPEIGWIEVETQDPDLVPPGPWLHFHYDLLAPPPGADVVARSPAGPAAFVLGRSLGLQFHPESTPAIGAEWARIDAERLERLGIDGPGLLDVDANGTRLAAMRLFDAWWARATSRPEGKMGTLSKIGEAELRQQTDRRRST